MEILICDGDPLCPISWYNLSSEHPLMTPFWDLVSTVPSLETIYAFPGTTLSGRGLPEWSAEPPKQLALCFPAIKTFKINTIKDSDSLCISHFYAAFFFYKEAY